MNFLQIHEDPPRPSSRSSASSSAASRNIDFIPPYSKSYTHRLKLIHEKRQIEEQRLRSDPYERRNFGDNLTFQAPNGDKMHHSQRTFGLHALQKPPVNRLLEQELQRGRSRSRSNSGYGDDFYRNASASRSRSRSRDSSVGSTGGGGLRSRSRSFSNNSRASSAHSVRSTGSASSNKFQKQLQINRDLEAKQKQEEALSKMKKDAYVNYLKSKSSLQQQPWVPSGKGPKHNESQHKNINLDASDKLVQTKAWRKAGWPGLLPEEKKNYDNVMPKSLTLSVRNNEKKEEQIRKNMIAPHTYINSHEVPLPIEADPETDYRTALPSTRSLHEMQGSVRRTASQRNDNQYDMTRTGPMGTNELNFTAMTPNNSAPGSPNHSRHHYNNRVLPTVPSSSSVQGMDLLDAQSVGSYNTSSSNTTGRKVILSHVSNHLALTIRMITLSENGSSKNSYGILALRRKCNKADLVASIEKQFNVFGKVSDISIASKHSYSGKVTITSLSMGTIEDVPDINDDSDIVVYVGGALYQQPQISSGEGSDPSVLYSDFLFSQPLRDFRAQSVERERPSTSQPSQGLLNVDDKLFYDSMVNTVQAFDDYAAKESRLTDYYHQQRSSNGGPMSAGSLGGSLAGSPNRALPPAGDQGSRLRELDVKKHAFSVPKTSLGAPKHLSVDQIILSGSGSNDFHPSQINALAEAAFVEHPEIFQNKTRSPQKPFDVDEELRKEQEDARLMEQFGTRNNGSEPFTVMSLKDKSPHDLAGIGSSDPFLQLTEDATTTTASITTMNDYEHPNTTAQNNHNSNNNNNAIALHGIAGDADQTYGHSVLPLSLADIHEVNSIGQSARSPSPTRQSPLTLSEMLQLADTNHNDKQQYDQNQYEEEDHRYYEEDDGQRREEEDRRYQREDPGFMVSTPITNPANKIDQLEQFYHKVTEKAEKDLQQPSKHPLGVGANSKHMSSNHSIGSVSSRRSNSTSRSLNSRKSRSKSPGKPVPVPITRKMQASEDRFLNRMSAVRATPDEPQAHLTFQPQFYTSSSSRNAGLRRSTSADRMSQSSESSTVKELRRKEEKAREIAKRRQQPALTIDANLYSHDEVDDRKDVYEDARYQDRAVDIDRERREERQRLSDRYNGPPSAGLLSTPISPIPVIPEDDDIPLSSSYRRSNHLPQRKESERKEEETVDVVRVASSSSLSPSKKNAGVSFADVPSQPVTRTRHVKEIFLDLKTLLDAM